MAGRSVFTMFGLVRVHDFSGSLSHTVGVPDNSPSVVNEHSRGQASPATMQSVYVNEERILFGAWATFGSVLASLSHSLSCLPFLVWFPFLGFLIFF